MLVVAKRKSLSRHREMTTTLGSPLVEERWIEDATCRGEKASNNRKVVISGITTEAVPRP